jgi:hypothetical protein
MDFLTASVAEGKRGYGKSISNGILGSTQPLVKKFLGHMKVIKSGGGWKMFCLTEAARIGIHREAFLKAFKSIREREKHLTEMMATEKDLGKSFSGKLKSLP